MPNVALSSLTARDEALIETCVVDGVLDVRRLQLVSDNASVIAKAFSKWPISEYELYKRLLRDGEIKTLFRRCFDHNLDIDVSLFLTDPIQDRVLLEEIAKRIPFGPNAELFGSTDEQMILMMRYRETHLAYEALGQAVRDKILGEMPLVGVTYRSPKEFDRAYFSRLLAQGNFRSVAIDLCAKLEKILEEDYGYEGTFQDMIDGYSKDRLIEDADGNKTRMPIISKLHCLRIYRNSIAHPSKKNIEFDVGDLRECLDYIFEMEEKAHE